MIIVYVTYSNAEEATQVSETLVGERLVACTNIMSAHQSLYWWEGKVERSEEVAVIYKTHSEQFDAVKGRVLEMHSYDVPCIVSWPIEQGHVAFLDWVGEEVK